MKRIGFGICILIFGVALLSQFSIFQSTADTVISPACSNIKLYDFGMNSNKGVLTPGHVSVSLSSRAGDLIVVIVGLNEWRNPVSVHDSIGTSYQMKVLAYEPPSLTKDHEPDALLEIYVGFAKQTSAKNVVTVYSRSLQFDVLVGQYSGVSGIGKYGSTGGKSNNGSYTMLSVKSSSYIVGGLERYSGTSPSPGIKTTVGHQLGAISTDGSGNNAGSNFMENSCGNSLTLSTSLAGSNAWALGAVELLST